MLNLNNAKGEIRSHEVTPSTPVDWSVYQPLLSLMH